MCKLIHSLILQPEYLIHAAALNKHSFNRKHVVNIQCLIPRLYIPKRDIAVIDQWLLSLHLLLVVLILELGNLGVDAPHLLFVNWSIYFVVLHLFFED